jgi:hypothetical protein
MQIVSLCFKMRFNALSQSRGAGSLVHWANADPVGDFFKKLGQSISKAFQPQPTPSPDRKKRASGRPTARESNAVEAEPSPLEEASKPGKEEKSPLTVLRASAVPAEKAKGDLPYGIPVPGQKGLVISPYLPEGNYVDVSAFAPGSAVKDPYTVAGVRDMCR